MTATEHRRNAVRSTVERIRNIEATLGVTTTGLEQIELQLRELASHTEWFTENEFPAPQPRSEDSSFVYRISEDPQDNRFALYIQSARAPTNTPAHNHDTWAAITGIRGEELNRFYRRSNGGVEVVGSHVVRPGSGVSFLPDDLHSIHIIDDETVINFHMYGLGLEYLTEREYYDNTTESWKKFKDRSNIVDAGYVTR
ncbi:MAG: hypothetical protein OXI60_04100 [Acidiferrobacterales bacterium]|nr:hypothetical protein [Acidiferrobacterales bacterium]